MKKSLFLVVVLFFCGTLFAQMANPQEPLKNDPSVTIGKLDNGLTYYIMHNAKPEKRAEFYLLTHVGAIQETPAQNGLAHFLEHMALNGTKNFPGKGIISYLESIGCSFGLNINASTGVEQTMYMLNNVPVIRESILDTCLMVMHDYAAYVTNDAAEIEKERGVIIEEWRTRNTSDWRTMEALYKTLYKGSKYATCNIIGTVENLESFPPIELQNFYKTWYRPDHQAIVVIGDINPAQVENKLKALFADIPAPATPSPKKAIYIPENDEPNIGIFSDKEAQSTQMMYVIKSEPVPADMRPLGMVFMVDMFKELISTMLNERFSEIAQQPNAPFINAGQSFSSLTTTMDAAIFSVVSKDGEAVKAFEAMLMEIEKMTRFGFTESELERAKTNYLRQREYAANNVADRTNAELIYPAINHFFNHYPLLDPVYQLEVAKGYMPFIQLEQLNQAAKEMITEENRVLFCATPEREGLEIPTEAQFLEVMTKVAGAELEAYKEEVSDEPIVDEASIKGGKVVASKSTVFGATEWTLSNGVKVIVKPTDLKKDEVIINSWSDGGRSALPIDLLPSVESNVFTLWNQSCGLGNFTATALRKKLTGKLASITPILNTYSQGFNGGSSPQDFETLLQLFYASMVTPRFVESEFEAPMAQLNAIIPNLETNPSYALQQNLMSTLFPDCPTRLLISTELLKKVSLANLEKAYRLAFGQADGMTISIIGNIDPETIKPMVEKYLGGLPTTGKAPKWTDDGGSIRSGKHQNHFNFAMETPKTTVIKVYSGKMDYNLENDLYLGAVKRILDMTYTKTLREEEGGTYGAGVETNLTCRPKDQSFMIVSFETEPEKAANLSSIAEKDIQDIIQNGPSEEFVSKTKENLLKQFSENQISNNYWGSAIETYYMFGLDIVTSYEAIVKAMDVKSIQKFLSKLVKQNNFIDMSMNPSK